MYLESIWRTIQNVKIGLSDWLVRIYLDKSVPDFIDKLKIGMSDLEKDDLSEISVLFEKSPFKMADLEEHYVFGIIKSFENISAAPNCEIFTFDCSPTNELEKTRAYRLLPMIDDSVSICILRDADGFVSMQDCNNIRKFESDPTSLFYVLPYNNNQHSIQYFDENDTIGNFRTFPYAIWLTMFILFQKDYFSRFTNVTDLQAGNFGSKLKVSSLAYWNSVQTCNAFFSESVQMALKRRFPIHEKSVVSLFAYDEVLLLDLFKTYISFGRMEDPQKVQALFSPKSPKKITLSLDDVDLMEKIQHLVGVNIRETFVYSDDDLNLLETLHPHVRDFFEHWKKAFMIDAILSAVVQRHTFELDIRFEVPEYYYPGFPQTLNMLLNIPFRYPQRTYLERAHLAGFITDFSTTYNLILILRKVYDFYVFVSTVNFSNEVQFIYPLPLPLFYHRD